MKHKKYNKKNKIYYFVGITIFIVFSIVYLSGVRLNNIKNLASVFFVNSTTTKQLINDYSLADKGIGKIKIVVVPGHNTNSGGTEFRGIKERNLNVKLSEDLVKLLRKNKNFEVTLTRTENKNNKEIQTYIDNNSKAIKDFRENHKDTMDSLIRLGLVDTRKGIEHNNAPSATVLQLYGINKWANENNINMIIHVHFNDYPGRKYNRSGKYSGFAIYIPEKQFSNAKASLSLAKNVFNRLSKYSPVSNLPIEKKGIIEDQELIATGAYNTLNPAVMLIEYGYIYEAKLTSPKIQPLAIKEMAYQTYLGILNFLKVKSTKDKNTYNSSTLPYQWKNNLKKGVYENKDVFALQTALTLQSLYPPRGKSKNDCPINGNFGPCTNLSVINFQKKYNIKPAFGFVGPLTRLELNKLYSKQQ